jgi:hypothetical protein
MVNMDTNKQLGVKTVANNFYWLNNNIFNHAPTTVKGSVKSSGTWCEGRLPNIVSLRNQQFKGYTNDIPDRVVNGT